MLDRAVEVSDTTMFNSTTKAGSIIIIKIPPPDKRFNFALSKMSVTK
jgi:hypothetical protein